MQIFAYKTNRQRKHNFVCFAISNQLQMFNTSFFYPEGQYVTFSAADQHFKATFDIDYCNLIECLSW